MIHALTQAIGFVGTAADAARPAETARRTRPVLSWRKAAKYSAGLVLLAIGVLTTHQTVLARASREAVINGRVVAIRAPIDGILTIQAGAPGAAVEAGSAIVRLEDPHPDDARLFSLQQEAAATQRERDSLQRRLNDLKRARSDATAQAEAYRLGRVQQDTLRVEEAEAALAAATVREADAVAALKRGDALHQRGFQSDEANERARRAREIAQHETVAARKRLDALRVELQAARNGTYLGDNYNDVPSSFQRARELTVRIDEIEATLAQLGHKAQTLALQMTAEERRLSARTTAALSAPISGNVWATLATSGEFVRKGQELLAIVDCSTAVVTAAVSERDYNELRLGDAVRFRVAGSKREYAGSISKLGLTSTGASFAISPEERHYQVAIGVPGLAVSVDDRCAVGRSGEVVFESRGSGFATQGMAALRRILGLS